MADKISIIVPCYNAVKFAKRCVDSLTRQTYNNIEILLVDDGSTDETLVLLKELAMQDERIKVFEKSNGGPSSARNLALKNASGKYICFVDCDDWVEDDFVESLYNAFSSKSDIIMTACKYKWHKPSEKHFNARKQKEDKIFSLIEAKQQMFCDRYLFMILCNKMFLAKVAKEIKLCEEIKQSEDCKYLFEYLSAFQSGEVVFVQKPLYHYIQNKGSLSGFAFDENKFRQLRVFDEISSAAETQVLPYVKAWEYLITLELMFIAKKAKRKDLYRTLIKRAEKSYPYYKAKRKEYLTFRRFGRVLFWLIKLI